MYSVDEPINITIVAKNITNKAVRLWIDAGNYPTGTELTLLDAMGESMVKQHWAFLSSQVYTTEESEQFKTTILPQEEFKKEYKLLSIIQLNKNLTKGVYKLSYNNAPPITFEIK
jgi:hypothetical protein